MGDMTTGDVLILLSRLEFVLPQLTAVHVDALRLSPNLAAMVIELERLAYAQSAVVYDRS